MASITIQVDDDLLAVLEQVAQAQAKDVSQLVVEVLVAEMLEAQRFPPQSRHHDLDDLFGSWTQEEYERIQGEIDAQRQIDLELWS